MRKHPLDTSDLDILSDVPYIDDGSPCHLLDIYRPKGASPDIPVIVNIHGGGLFASYKTVNTWFNHEWARMGYAVVSISYRRIPETTLIHQIEDVVSALSFISSKKEEFSLNLDRCFLTGDSAGALLSLFTLSLQGSGALQDAFGIPFPQIRFRASGLVSIMLDTRRKDIMRAMSDVVTSSEDRGKPYEKYLLDPVSVVGESSLPPIFLATSAEVMIRKDTLKLEGALSTFGKEHALLDFPKGEKEKLIHVFSVQYPLWPESRRVFGEIDSFFRSRSL